MHVDWPLTPKSNPLWLRWFHREEARSRIKWHKILLQGVTTKSGILTNFVTYAICMMMWKLFWLLNEWPQEAMNTLRYSSRLGTNHAWILGKNMRLELLLRDSRRSYFSMNFDTANRAMNLNFLSWQFGNITLWKKCKFYFVFFSSAEWWRKFAEW